MFALHSLRHRPKTKKGFTLLELLLVISIIGILASITIVAINPSKQFAESRDAKRKSDVNTILNAVYQYSLDNNGTLPTGIGTTAAEICNTGVLAATCTTDSLVDLTVLTTNEKYLVSVPTDPSGATTNGAGYEILKTANNRITVSAPDYEGATAISATK